MYIIIMGLSNRILPRGELKKITDVVNRSFVTKYTQKAVYIGQMEIPVSAKYRSEITTSIFETM